MKSVLVMSAIIFLLSAGDDGKAAQKNTPESKMKLSGLNVGGKPRYTAEVIPKNMTVLEKKERFRQLLVPAIRQVFSELDQQYVHIKGSITGKTDSVLIERLKKSYKASSDQDLLSKLKPHPISIVLAQAAMESAWATSRFFREARNIFGVWSFNKNEPRIAAGEKRGSKTVWLKKYKSIEESVRDYYRVIARGAAFKKFRQLRLVTSNPFRLVKGLDKYSELGSKYSKQLAAVIRHNRFNQFDIKK